MQKFNDFVERLNDETLFRNNNLSKPKLSWTDRDRNGFLYDSKIEEEVELDPKDELKIDFDDIDGEMDEFIDEAEDDLYEDDEEVNESVSEDKREEKYGKWKSLINMSAKQIESFLESESGKDAGLSKEKASKLGISRGRDSARALIRMLESGSSYKKAVENWSANDWKWMSKQIGFVSRMSKGKGKLYDEDGEKTRWLKSLLIWGHDPRKK